MEARALQVDVGKCLGCRACSTVCPAGLIILQDYEGRRTVRFAASCSEDCTLCVPACPEGAITLLPGVRGTTLEVVFDLLPCAACHSPFITTPVLNKLQQELARALGPADLSWLPLCPSCRQAQQGQAMTTWGIG
jgi:ferredoxin